MPNIMKGQNYRINLETSIALVGSTITKVLYRTPNGLKGEWPAVINGTQMYYDVPADINNMAGLWWFEAYVELGGSKFIGDVAQLNITDTILN